MIIRNLTNKMLVFVLVHQQFCVKAGKCFCNPNGTPSSIYIPPNRKVEVNDAAVNVDEIVAAKKKNQITFDVPPVKAPAVDRKKMKRTTDKAKTDGGI